MRHLIIALFISLNVQADAPIYNDGYNYSPEWEESDDLAGCLNNSDTVSEAFNICIDEVVFKYPAANELAACISKNRDLTDDELSAYVIEECY